MSRSGRLWSLVGAGLSTNFWKLWSFVDGSLVGSVLTSRAVSLLGRARVLGLGQLLFGLGIGVPAFTTEALLVGAGLRSSASAPPSSSFRSSAYSR